MKHKSADIIQQQLKDYSTDQELKYWQERTRVLNNKRVELLKQQES